MSLLNFEMPGMDTPEGQGLLSAAFSLLQARKRPGEGLGSALGQAGQQYLGARSQAQDQAQRRSMQDLTMKGQQLQLDQAQQARTKEQNLIALRARFQRPDGFDYQGYAQALAADPAGSPEQAFDWQQRLQKDDAPVKLGEGEVLYSGKASGYKPLAQGNPKAETVPEVTKLMAQRDKFPVGHPYRKVYDDAIRKASTHQPATSVNVNTEKPLLNSVAAGLGKQIDDSLAAARAAIPAIGTAQRLMAAVDSGKIVSGPGASFRVAGLQIGQMLGVGGGTGAEILQNTRSAIQSMAQAELDAAQQMKGQGQITESERDIIRRAASGKIDDLTGPEIKLLAQSMEKTARYKIKSHESNVGALKNMKGAEPLIPFYQVQEPPTYSAPGGGPAGFRVLGKE